VAAGLSTASLTRELAGLVTPEVVYYPIRHHSPACAWHLEQLLRARRPSAVLIEGPARFTSLIPLMLHEKTRPPFAVYTSFVPGRDERAESKETDSSWPDSLAPWRSAAFYPFCEYSPEWVALRVGREVGAALRFIDLDYAAQARAERRAGDLAENPRVRSLLAERHFQRSRFLAALTRRAGCRDHNELWDHLFETRLTGGADESMRFVRDVGAWCRLARADASPDELAADGTEAREKAMAAAIQAELAAQRGLVVVVTGGFHAVALPGLVAGSRLRAAAAPPSEPLEENTCLVRYSFEQLDALNGYTAGMPSPFYYDLLWREARLAPLPEVLAKVAARVLVELGRRTRQQKLAVGVSSSDEIAALEQASRLARMRGHPGPTREDLLDGVRSCLVKGAMDAEGTLLLGLAREVLTGGVIGEVPPEAGQPPLVEDFRRTAAAYRFPVHDSIERKISLDLYRKGSHRARSRFLHGLAFLEVPFGELVAGPDFVQGVALERLFEHWECKWTPQTEARLVEASAFGTTVEEAAAGKLRWTLERLEKLGRGRSAVEAVGLLVQACRMGLHRHTPRLLALIAGQISEDASVVSVVEALHQLQLLWHSREPLEAHRLASLPVLVRQAYERAGFLLRQLSATPAEAATETLRALELLRAVVHGVDDAQGELNGNLFWEPLAFALSQPDTAPLLLGGIAGLLHAENRLGEDALLRLLAGSLQAAASDPGRQTEFLIGLLQTCRELAWRQPALVQAVDALLQTWSEEDFLCRVPHLRLAFAGLTPRETDRVAEVVAQTREGLAPPSLHRSDFSSADLWRGACVNQAVRESLREDGLGAWLEDASVEEHA